MLVVRRSTWPEPSADDVQVDSAVQHVHGRRVPDDVRRHALALERWDATRRSSHVLLEDVVNSESRERPALGVAKNSVIALGLRAPLVE